MDEEVKQSEIDLEVKDVRINSGMATGNSTEDTSTLKDMAIDLINHYRMNFYTTFMPGMLGMELKDKTFDTLVLVDQYDEVLKKEIPPHTGDASELRETSISMLGHMIHYGGIGMAAPQVNLNLNLFVMGHKSFGYWTCINPEILAMSETTETISEGCLSFPGLFLKIPRPYTVKAKFTDIFGKTYIVDFEGIWARVFLHEYEHLHGVLFTTKVSKVKLDLARSKIKKHNKK